VSAGLAELLAAVARTRVCIVGDVLLDVFTRVHAGRVCPDAPALIVREHDVTYRASGAALAAQALRSLGVDVQLITVLGGDDAGRRVARLIRRDGTSLKAVTVDRPTPSKNRIIAGHPGGARAAGQVLLRLDREDATDVTSPVEAVLIGTAREAIGRSNAVLLSDYTKGVCTPALTQAVIEASRAVGIPVIVDPKHPDATRYAGATVLTPNLAELAAMTGRRTETSEVRDLARRLRTVADVEWVLATRDAEGLTAVGPDGAQFDVPAFPDDVIDVAGAGDVFAGALAAALACALMRRAAVVGSLAAGLSLRHEAHKQVTPEELLKAADRHAVTSWFLDMEVQGA